MKSKGDFVSHMLVEELVGKRLQLLQNFREGLDYFGFVGTSTTECRCIYQPF